MRRPLVAAREIFFVAQDEVGLHGGAKRIDVAVGVFAGKRIVIFGESVVILVIDEALTEFACSVCRRCAGKREKNFRAACRFRPRCRRWILCGRASCSARLSAFSGRCGRTASVARFRTSSAFGIGGKFVRVDQAAAGLVEGVAGQAIVDVELAGGLDGFAKGADEDGALWPASASNRLRHRLEPTPKHIDRTYDLR